jgi:kynureninase
MVAASEAVPMPRTSPWSRACGVAKFSAWSSWFPDLAARATAAHHGTMDAITLDEARALDKQDALAGHRAEFLLPPGVIYLDGNSLGPLPRQTPARLARVVEQEWGQGLIRSWADAGWMQAQRRVGDKIGRILGARPGEVVVADSTSVNLYKLMVAGARLRPGRGKIVLETGDFPTDLHMAEAAARVLPGVRVELVARDALAAAIDGDTALAVLCHVQYRTGCRHDMAAMNSIARRQGALVLWDLSHSAGAIGVDLGGNGADMAVGCGYKFFNGGPGAPAYLYVAERLQAVIETPLPGWMGHAAPFDFAESYRPAAGAARFQCGTPPILSVAALESGVDQFLGVDRAALFAKSAALFDLFAEAVAVSCPSLALITPRDADRRGSHIAFRHQDAARIMQALAQGGVIGDFRPPDVLRFGLTPLYTGFEDIARAVRAIARCAGLRPGEAPPDQADQPPAPGPNVSGAIRP